MDQVTDQKIEAEKAKGNILNISSAEQFRTVSELFERSQSNSVYYTLLILSIVIISTGLLLNNPPIVIGGMLVTPLLTPILVIGLGIAVGELGALKTPSLLIIKSVLLSISIPFILSFAFGVEGYSPIFSNTLRTAILYFAVAAASGIAATFAWVRKEVADILPGTSIAVSLVPPLSYLGISLGVFDFDTSRFYMLIFLFNLFGIIFGSFIVFSLLKFQSSGWAVKEKMQEARDIEQSKRVERIAEKAKEKLKEVKEKVEKLEEIAGKEGL